MMKNTRLRDMITEGIYDSLYIWKEELKKVFKDGGVLIFFLLAPFIYPVIYSFIYNNEVARNVKMVVVDASDTFLSREFTRRMNAAPDVRVVEVCRDMETAKRMLDRKEAYGILLIPSDFSKTLVRGEKQAHVSLYCDMSSLLYYKAFYLTATEVSLEMGTELQIQKKPAYTSRAEEIQTQPILSESTALYNPQSGFGSFLVPAILVLVVQQTLLLGIGMLSGTDRERNRFHTIVPLKRHFGGTLRVVFGKSLAYLVIYIVVCIWLFAVVPNLFSFPRVSQPFHVLAFLLPYLFACIFMAMTVSGFLRSRESPMLIFVFTSVLLLFISGISWPKEAIPPFWKAIGYVFPSTPGIQGFIRIHSMGATLKEVAFEYRLLWIQAAVYFLSACLVYRTQYILTRQRMKRRYQYAKERRDRKRARGED
ncbi:ABC transporter permease [Parabacteroides sp. Marseille-P3160]|uniref:ABC transporter permease n=1 Tax=Parabacteroides sp. Marseille-P3160 TaxID=1917887 RepID=UPI0009BC2B55|nr:ABC transporter permease [Parabacteroides sp. Marseille-P3160]